MFRILWLQYSHSTDNFIAWISFLEFPAWKFIFTVNGLSAGEAFDGVNTSHSIFRFLGRLHHTIIRITLKNSLRALANFAKHVCPRKPYLRRALSTVSLKKDNWHVTLVFQKTRYISNNHAQLNSSIAHASTWHPSKVKLSAKDIIDTTDGVHVVWLFNMASKDNLIGKSPSTYSNW